MKRSLLLLLILLSFKAFSQQHWEDNFWREEAKKRYSKTFTMAGMYTAFYSNGKIKWQGKCLENGNPDSVWVYYDNEGHKLWEGEYNGKYYEYTEYYDYRDNEGESAVVDRSRWDTSIVGNYKNGLKDGEWRQYDNEGKFIFKKGQYRNGEPTGIWQEFREETVVTEIMKAAEYNYATQTRTLYKKDSIDGTSHIDSLAYDNWYGINGTHNNYDYNPPAQGDFINVGFCGSGQFINLFALNNYFFQKGYSKLTGPVESVGLDWSGNSESFYWSYNINWNPAISAQLNDSIRLRLSGLNTAIYFGGDLIKAKAVDLAPALGIGYQQLKLKVLKINHADSTAFDFHEGDFRVYKNPAPTLNAMLNLRLNMGGISLDLAGGYVLDCASPKWRYNGKFLPDSPGTSVSGFIAHVSLSFHIEE